MTYIICEPCVGTCDTACVDVCPVDCIHGPEDKTGAGEEAKVEGFDHTRVIRGKHPPGQVVEYELLPTIFR